MTNKFVPSLWTWFSKLPYSYLKPSNAELRLHCTWQLNLTGGNSHDGKGLLSQKFLWTGSFPWEAFFSLLKFNLSLKSCTFYSNFPAASWSSLLKCTRIQNQVVRWSFWGNFSSVLLQKKRAVQQSMPVRWVYDKHCNNQSLLLLNISQGVSPCWKTVNYSTNKFE